MLPYSTDWLDCILIVGWFGKHVLLEFMGWPVVYKSDGGFRQCTTRLMSLLIGRCILQSCQGFVLSITVYLEMFAAASLGTVSQKPKLA